MNTQKRPTEREKQEIALRVAAPLQQARFAPVRQQHGTNDLALFGAVAAPTML